MRVGWGELGSRVWWYPMQRSPYTAVLLQCVNIPVDHPDAGSPLLRAVTQAFVSMGAVVSVEQTGENLVRTVESGGGEPSVIVQAQGLPNLIHELVHALHAGRLADDHGIDYTGIPFDLTTPSGRELLWEELSCSLVSCAYLSAELARRGVGAPDRDLRVDAWFAEQVEIQPVFYGMEDHPPGFFARVGSLLSEHEAEVCAVVQRATTKMRSALEAEGAPAHVAQAEVQGLSEIWERVLGQWARPPGSA